MKKLHLFLLTLFLALSGMAATPWEQPRVPGADVTSVGSATVYMYNVKADAFVTNGMTWNTNAIAMRLKNGDTAASSSQAGKLTATATQLKFSLSAYSAKSISCLGADANNIYVDQSEGNYFRYAETSEGSHVYTLTNVTYSKPLDVTWSYGGHLTLVGGAGLTDWAFIPETSITDGTYLAYKVRKQMYALYAEVCGKAEKAEAYGAALDKAYTTYSNATATVAELREAALAMLQSVYPAVENDVDVSYLYTNADMIGAQTCEGWTTAAPSISAGDIETFHASLTLSQTASVPNGQYRIVLHGLYRNDGSAEAPVLRAKTTTTTTAKIPSIADLDWNVGNAEGNGWTDLNGVFVPNNMTSAAQALTHDKAVAELSDINVTNGALTLSVAMTNTTQWLNWQGLRIYLQKGDGSAALSELKAMLDEALTYYGEGLGKEADKLKAAIDASQAVYDNENSATSEMLSATVSLSEAIDAYIYANASAENPLDYTDLIVNPSFENSWTGWTQSGFSLQTNTAFSRKKGNTYAEKWVAKGSLVGDALLSQTLPNVPLGTYILKVAAQNIQEDAATKAQTGAFIFAGASEQEVTTNAQYTLAFNNIENDVVLGFRALSATGNWLSVDNFQLLYAGYDEAALIATMQSYVDQAITLSESKTGNAEHEALLSVIEAGKAALQAGDVHAFPSAATPLRLAIDAARTSQNDYATLLAAIEYALSECSDTKQGVDDYMTAIEAVKKVYTSGTSTKDEMLAAQASLNTAAFAFRLANPSGAIPRVVTDPRYARGAIEAFGRMSYSGITDSKVLEEGFCWSETNPEPTVMDHRSTSYLTNNGKIYRMPMNPGTLYYIRAYVMTTGYQVGYGDVIRMSTLPKGNVTYTYNNGGDAAANNRINYSLGKATGYWTNYTSISGFNVSCTYSPGTPTADCGYGGGMRMGSVAGNQKPGVCMHEMSHGIGGGTIPVWGGFNESFLRVNGVNNGYWAGERAQGVLHFWENNENLNIRGAYDGAHWWFDGYAGFNQDASYNNFGSKYSFNGSHLDEYSWAGPSNANDMDVCFIGNSLINQGMCEDGLIPVNYWSGAFCLPAYVFPHIDHQKYFLKSESEAHGRNGSFLVEVAGKLQWKEMTADEATENDNAAWYVTFTPGNQYYQLQNAATGHYISYAADGNNGFKAVAKSKPTASENLHVMRSRYDLKMGSKLALRGFWLIHPAAMANPPCLTAQANGVTSATNVDLHDGAEHMRWLLLTDEQLQSFDAGVMDIYLVELKKMIANVRTLVKVPHTEDTAGIDASTEATLKAIEAQGKAATSAATVTALIDEARQCGMDFLDGATPKTVAKPFDITFLVKNAAIDDNTGWSQQPTFGNSCCEFFQTTFDFNQTIKNIPAGTYQLHAQAFQRYGTAENVCTSYQKGTNNVRALLYAGAKTQKICHIAQEAQNDKLHADDVAAGNPSVYVPNTMPAAAAYFAKGYYDNAVTASVATTGGSLKIGLKCTTTVSGHWTIFDNFRLYYYGKMTIDDVTPVEQPVVLPAESLDNVYYDLSGRRVQRPTRGIYIVGGKKVMR